MSAGTLDKLAPAVVALQAALSPVGKSAANPFFKSKYAPLPEVRASLQPLLAANGLALMTFPAIIDTPDGPCNGLHFYLIHESGQYLDGQWLLTPTKRDPQGEGSDCTYKRRYAEMAICGAVADEDDDGNRASIQVEMAPPPKRKQASKLDTAKAQLREAIMKAKLTKDQAAEYAWVATATDDDLDKITGLVEVLSMGKAVAG